ncbi:hypothetical protein BS47DRAFT_1402865 [Hydnum rufescens UP504]|uniref:Uncharacterized protein n=1 Tax=Hydnum rufescens UP504 TaxID=1448309 RepID=A0A9P6DL83_9AGAM|nr:hypothetical protein BS47DRAFT_1402865 [Hydnum rufescens UP504]
MPKPSYFALVGIETLTLQELLACRARRNGLSPTDWTNPLEPEPSPSSSPSPLLNSDTTELTLVECVRTPLMSPYRTAHGSNSAPSSSLRTPLDANIHDLNIGKSASRSSTAQTLTSSSTYGNRLPNPLPCRVDTSRRVATPLKKYGDPSLIRITKGSHLSHPRPYNVLTDASIALPSFKDQSLGTSVSRQAHKPLIDGTLSPLSNRVDTSRRVVTPLNLCHDTQSSGHHQAHSGYNTGSCPAPSIAQLHGAGSEFHIIQTLGPRLCTFPPLEGKDGHYKTVICKRTSQCGTCYKIPVTPMSWVQPIKAVLRPMRSELDEASRKTERLPRPHRQTWTNVTSETVETDMDLLRTVSPEDTRHLEPLAQSIWLMHRYGQKGILPAGPQSNLEGHPNNATSSNPIRDNRDKQDCKLHRSIVLVRGEACYHWTDYTVDLLDSKTTDTGCSFSMIRTRKPCDSALKLELNRGKLVRMFVSVKLESMVKSARVEGWDVTTGSIAVRKHELSTHLWGTWKGTDGLPFGNGASPSNSSTITDRDSKTVDTKTPTTHRMLDLTRISKPKWIQRSS